MSLNTSRDASALQTLVNDHGVDIRRLPDDVLTQLRALSEKVVEDVASKDPKTRRIYESFVAFKRQAIAWHNISERAYLESRQG